MQPRIEHRPGETEVSVTAFANAGRFPGWPPRRPVGSFRSDVNFLSPPRSAARRANVDRVSDGVSMSMSVPLDSDGFMRRECPTCEREFKWLPTPEDEEGTEAPDGGYFCPYCAIQAPANAWFTKAQVEQVEALVARDVVAPTMAKWARDITRSSRGSGLVSVKTRYESDAPEPQELTEDDDMRRVDLGCHPDEPVKILDDWDRSVHCLLCGAPA